MSTAFRVGLFVFFGLLFLSIGVFLIGSKDFLFSPTYRLKANFHDVSGLNNGADVRVAGIHVGSVQRIDLPSRPQDPITVLMNLRSSTQNIIKKDSVASIKTEGLLGDKYVEISFGSPKAEDVQGDDTIASLAPPDMAQQAEQITTEAQSGVAAFRDDMQALQSNFLLKGFFKDRGYSNPSELTAHAISRVPSEPYEKKFEYGAAKIFGKGENAKLKNKKALEEVGQYLQANHYSLAVVESTEATGDTAKDRVLTEARANVVRDYLVQNFKLDDTHLKTIGMGKTKPDDDSSKIDILVYSSGSARTAAPASPPVQSSSLPNPQKATKN